MFIELRLYSCEPKQYTNYFVFEDKKLQFSFEYNGVLFVSPEYITSKLNYLVFHPKNNVNVIDEQFVVDLCNHTSTSFDCISEAFATIPRFSYVCDNKNHFGSLDELEKDRHANGDEFFQISYLKDAFAKAMFSKRKVRDFQKKDFE